MSFCIKRKEPFSKAIQRIGHGRIRHALECLESCEHSESIHCARKDIKKVRAVLRLACDEIGRKDFRRVIKPLRKAAKCLAVPRDAYVRLNVLTTLKQHFKGQLAPGALQHVRARLKSASEHELKQFGKGKAAKQFLRCANQELKALRVRGKGWKALQPGLRTAYTHARRAYQIASGDPGTENFHEWRKCAKTLWYQVWLLQRLWPEQIEAMAGELETLSDHLGDHHDLVMLRKAIEDPSLGKMKPTEIETLNGLAEERQRELRAAALALGARFFAEKPSAFSDRLAGYWRIWRSKNKSSAFFSQESTP